MSGEEQAQAWLRDRVAALPPVLPDSAALATALARAVEACEAAEGMRERMIRANAFPAGLEAGISAVVAAESAVAAVTVALAAVAELRRAVAGTTAKLRATMGEVMSTSGASAVQTRWHVATALEPSHHVEILEPTKLPAAYWRTPEPEPDKARALRDLKAGREVPGAALEPGAYSLRIVARDT